MDKIQKRPKFITFLAYFHFAFAIFMLLLLIFILFDSNKDFGFLFLFLILASPWLLLTGIALYRGTKWGWWMFAFNCTFGLIRTLNAFDVISNFVHQGTMSDDVVLKQVDKYRFRLFLYILLLSYLFSDKVLNHFKVAKTRNFKLFFTLLIPTFGVFLLVNFINLILAR